MRKHNGMRPQDIAVLLKIIALNRQDWQMMELASSMRISLSEISSSISRSRFSNLLDPSKKRVNRLNLLEFLEFGIRYVFPVQPGTLVRGFPTAHSFQPMKSAFMSDMDYVWPSENGDRMGLGLEPYYMKQAEAAKDDELFHHLLALTDMIRIGKVREVSYAVLELKKIFSNERSN